MTRFLLVLLMLGLLALAEAGACLTANRGERPSLRRGSAATTS
jgi:hypothetical protein